MQNIITGKILSYENGILTVAPSVSIDRELLQKQVENIELRLNDGRTISAEQRKKIFAIIRDISIWSGDDPGCLRKCLTWDFRSMDDIPEFSLSDVDMTTAKDFITYLIEFCFKFGVGTKDTLLHQNDDIERYLYLCLEYRKCAICNAHADVHHIDHIGIGRNRDNIIHVGMLAIALCRKHHQEAEDKGKQFLDDNYIFGIPLDTYLCKVLRLNTKERRMLPQQKIITNNTKGE